jgi:hypothetical protein
MAEQENHHGWSPDVDGDDPTAAEAADKARAASASDEGGGPGDHSVGGTLTDTDTEPDAGDSARRSAEDIARDAGREADSHKGAAQRPYGTAD